MSTVFCGTFAFTQAPHNASEETWLMEVAHLQLLGSHHQSMKKHQEIKILVLFCDGVEESPSVKVKGKINDNLICHFLSHNSKKPVKLLEGHTWWVFIAKLGVQPCNGSRSALGW